jgi:hypothetical protein
MKYTKFFLMVPTLFASTTSPMLTTTTHAPKAFFKTQKMSKTFLVPVGKSSFSFDGDILPLNIEEIHNDIKEIGRIKCTAQDFTKSIYGCSSNICCKGAAFLAMQKNIQAAQRSHAIKGKFLKSIGKKDKYLEEIEEIYLRLSKYRILLNEFGSNNLGEKEHLELYTMLGIINDCLFAQARIIVEDSFENWKDKKFTMTSTIKNIRDIRNDINAWHSNEKEYRDNIQDEKLKKLYEEGLVGYGIDTYKIGRIQEEYKLLHENKQRE